MKEKIHKLLGELKEIYEKKSIESGAYSVGYSSAIDRVIEAIEEMLEEDTQALPECYIPTNDGCSHKINGYINGYYDDEPIEKCKQCPLCNAYEGEED